MLYFHYFASGKVILKLPAWENIKANMIVVESASFMF